MWLLLVPAPGNNPSSIDAGYIEIRGLPWIGMKTADSRFVPWLASQTDVLADLEALALTGKTVIFGSRPAFWEALDSGRLQEIALSPPLQRSARFGSVSLAGRTLAPSVKGAKALAHEIFAGYAERLASAHAVDS